MNLKDIIIKVRDTITDNKTWQTEKQSVLAQLQEAETKLNDYAESAVTAANMKSGFETQLTELKDSHSKAVLSLNEQISNLQAKVEAESKSADVKAQAIASTVGITSEDKLPKVVKSTALTPEYVSEQMAKDKTFFANNKQAILKLAGIDPTIWDKSK